MRRPNPIMETTEAASVAKGPLVSQTARNQGSFARLTTLKVHNILFGVGEQVGDDPSRLEFLQRQITSHRLHAYTVMGHLSQSPPSLTVAHGNKIGLSRSQLPEDDLEEDISLRRGDGASGVPCAVAKSRCWPSSPVDHEQPKPSSARVCGCVRSR